MIELCSICFQEHETAFDCSPKMTGLLKYLPKDFKLPDDYWELPEAEGEPGLYLEEKSDTLTE